MVKKNVHVVPSGNKWAVKVAGNAKPVSTHHTQGNAAAAGRPVAKRNQSELVIHRPNGQIRDSDSYGNDSCPPRDKKH
jgi:hypothetical protein